MVVDEIHDTIPTYPNHLWHVGDGFESGLLPGLPYLQQPPKRWKSEIPIPRQHGSCSIVWGVTIAK